MTQHKQAIEGTGKVFDKSKNAAEGEFFVKTPSNLFNYVHVPGYKPEYSYLYSIIIDYFNSDLGYAYPTEWQIARKYGKKDVKTVRTHLRFLESVGLLKIAKPYGNKLYIPYKPLNQAELFKACPEAEANYKEAIRKEEAEKERTRKPTAGELGLV